MKYNPSKIESKWQKFWEKQKLFVAKDPATIEKSKMKAGPKKYFLVEFPYPSGDGLHVGHIRSYVALDILSRQKRMQGFNVLYPIGWDAFGLPTENYAIKTGIHPIKVTEKNIKTFKRQLQSLGLSFDWSREINTTDPNYYKWTQWIFLKFFEKGLAYQAEMPINWCPSCKIGLANEEVVDGKCERCGAETERRKIKQWMLKITKYADRLIEDLDKVDYLEKIKTQQINWIGRSEGTEIRFKISVRGGSALGGKDSSQKEKIAIVIHGSPAEKNYLKMSTKNWLPYICKELEKLSYKVVCREMPHANQPKFEEWEETLKDISVDENTIIVGHSAGCSFAARWLTKNKKRIDKLILVAPSKFINEENQRLKELYDFEPAPDLANKALIIYSTDDKERIAESVRYYQRVLNNNELMVFHDRGHFTQSSAGVTELPEIIDWLKKDSEITVFTTRIDTIFGVTALVVAPEHQLILNLKSKILNLEEVEDYIEKAKRKSDLERAKLTEAPTTATGGVGGPTGSVGQKTGVELKGIKAINPLNNEEVPVWLADYVIASYGGGAVMMVPAHDYRDFEFAKKYNLPIKCVIHPRIVEHPLGVFDFDPSSEEQRKKIGKELSDRVDKILNGEEAYTEYGRLINSGGFNGLTSEEAIKKITEWLTKKNLGLSAEQAGKKVIQYKLRDWIFSRQHYWGEPIPLVFCENCAARINADKNADQRGPISENQRCNQRKSAFTEGELLNPGWVAVPDRKLPIKLPYVEKYEPSGTGESPLAKIEKWVKTKCPKCGGPARRETDTMPNWAGSNWYYLAYLLGNQKSKIKNQKLVWDKEKIKYWMPVDWYNGGMEHTTLHLLYSRFVYKFLYDLGVVSQSEPYQKRTAHGMVLAEDGRKMSKSFDNVINPDEIIKNYGADALRLYEMFMGPFDQAINWSTQGLIGCFRFLNRVWDLFNDDRKFGDSSHEIKIKLHQLIKKVSKDIESMKFNTAVAAMMGFVNFWSQENQKLETEDAKLFLKILSPFVPHLAEELWQHISVDLRKNPRKSASIFMEKWPKPDKKFLVEEEIEFVVQINGKVRDTLKVKIDLSEEEIKKIAQASEKIKKYLEGKTIRKTIFVPNKLINFVVS